MFEYYASKNKKNIKKANVLILIQNGSRFYSIFPLIITVAFAHLNTPYFYGSQLYDYKSFNWLATTDDYQNQSMELIFSPEKMPFVVTAPVFL